MSDATASVPSAHEEAGLRASALIAYGLFLFALCNGITVLPGVILAYIKRADARGTRWEGHFSNLITVFWIGLLVGVGAIATVAQGLSGYFWDMIHSEGHYQPPPEMIGWLAVAMPILYLVCVGYGVWFLYRVIRGFTRALDDKPY